MANGIEVKEYTHGISESPGRFDKNFFVFVNGRNCLMFTPWQTGHVTLEWDGKIELSTLEQVISVEIPRTIGLGFDPEAILRLTRYPTLGAVGEDLNAFRERIIRNLDISFRLDVKGQGIPKDSEYSLAVINGENDPAAYAFDSVETAYFGKGIELLVHRSRITPNLIQWISEHQVNTI